VGVVGWGKKKRLPWGLKHPRGVWSRPRRFVFHMPVVTGARSADGGWRVAGEY